MMPSNLITTFFSLCVGFAVMLLVMLAPGLIMYKLKMATAVDDAARTYAITGDAQAVQNQVNSDLAAEYLVTTYNGQNLFTVQQTQAGQGTTGYQVNSTPTSSNASVTFQYKGPVPFHKALTLFGGPAFNPTAPMQAAATDWNELQYTGAAP
jgi:Flp pilus assembly protein TadG